MDALVPGTDAWVPVTGQSGGPFVTPLFRKSGGFPHHGPLSGNKEYTTPQDSLTAHVLMGGTLTLWSVPVL